MTKEEKSLLLKDLSARLPYGVMVRLEEAVRVWEKACCKRFNIISKEEYIDLINKKKGG